MLTGFWTLIIVMALAAICFVAIPLLHHKKRLGPAGIAAMLPLFSVGIYLIVGSPQAADVDSVMITRPPASTGHSRPNNNSVASVSSMVDGLAARVKDDPNDAKSWLLLARSYQHLRRIPEATAAYERAAELGEFNEKLAALTETTVAEDSIGARISGHLRLSERSKAIVKPTDTVFVFARAAGGPSTPVAVVQRSAADLPLDFALTDSQAISPELKISTATEVVVTARMSRSGIATEALRGLEATSDVIVVAENRHLELTID